MTLVITHVSPWGIVMGADSALTETWQGKQTVLTDAPKLQPLEKWMGGASFYGQATIAGKYTWQWLPEVIEYHQHIDSLTDFADALSHNLNGSVTTNDQILGFHLAGFVDTEDGLYPQVFHVHNSHPEYPKNTSTVAQAQSDGGNPKGH